MRMLALMAAALGLSAFAAPAAVAAPSGRVGLVPAGEATFPKRSYRLTIPADSALRAEDLNVTENGEPVSKVALTSAGGAGGRRFGAILVIDASKSMRGAAIRGALSAARVLARQRTVTQRLGVVVFNDTSTVRLAPTDAQPAIDEALRRTPPLAPQTHIFDAVGTALDLLEQAKITAGSVVLLSDGSDTGSRISADVVARRARRANVSIYTVGLHSGAFDSGELKRLAAAGRGRYSAAESNPELRRIFRALGTQLASDYLLEFRSSSKPGRDVTVAVRVAGHDRVATAVYRVPGGATFVQIEDSFWTSRLGLAMTGMLCGLLLAIGLGIVLVRRGRAPTVRERVQRFVSGPADALPYPGVNLAVRPPGAVERSLSRTRWWPAFQVDVEIARITMDPLRIVILSAFATVVVFYLLALVSGFALVGLFALAIPWGTREWVRFKRDRQRAQFVEQLPDLLQAAASTIRAGHGLVGALSMVGEEAPEPIRTEILQVVADEALGVPLDEALRVVEHRMRSRDVMQIALIAQIQREAGGNIAEVLDRITESLRQRGELRRMVKALTAQGRLSRWVVTALPLALLLVISIMNPKYVDPLYTTTLGLVLLGIAGVIMAAGSVVIGKIVNFEV